MSIAKAHAERMAGLCVPTRRIQPRLHPEVERMPD